jgi:hypothetical protein
MIQWVHYITNLPLTERANMPLLGNGKGHRDPSLCLKKLLCFGEGTWRELRGLVGRKDRGRAAVRLNPQHLEPDIDEPLSFEDEDGLDIPASELRLGIALLDWWEVERWHEVNDEWGLWDDPSPETVRVAEALRKGKRMDT